MLELDVQGLGLEGTGARHFEVDHVVVKHAMQAILPLPFIC